MKLDIRLHLGGLSLSNTISELEKFGVDRSRKAVHDWVQKADLQPASNASPDHVALDATFFDRENASKHYCRRTNYRVQTLKATALADTESHPTLEVHCTTEKRHDTQLGWQVARRNAGDLASLAADKGYDWMELREKVREEDVRPLIKHREFRPIDPRVVRVIDGPRYRERAMCETVFSTIKRTLGDTVRARSWYGEFRELILMCVVHNIRQSLKQ